MLTANDRSRIQARARAAIDKHTLRKDPWWALPLGTGLFLVVAVAYSTWAGLQTHHYFADPYLSPLYSPCLAANCEETTFRLLGSWWIVSPFLIVGWLPIGFRATCYYYRKVYYRGFWASPPACAVAEPHRRYTGETRFPLVIQNLHRYFWYLMILNMVFLFWDTGKSFFFEDGFGIGVGTLVMVVMIVTMTLYMLSCHSCRHAVGGSIDVFSKAPLRYRTWKFINVLNERHGTYALLSLGWIPVTDLYIRLVAMGVIHDYRLF